MMAKRERRTAAVLVLGCACTAALLNVSFAAPVSVDWPAANAWVAALPSPHVAVRVVVEVKP